MLREKEKNNLPTVEYSNSKIIYNRYNRGNDYWDVVRLIDYCESQKYPIFDLPLAGLNLNVNPWDILNLDDFAYHMKISQEADLKHPIILDDLGQVCDGNHRVAKALARGDKSIKAIRIIAMPTPDGHNEL